jgi:IS5 family transposase
VNIDIIAQAKAISYPTDDRLYDRATKRLVVHPRNAGLSIRQSNARLSRRLVVKADRYVQARQMGRSKGFTRRLRMNLGRLIKDVERQAMLSQQIESKVSQVIHE